MVVDKKEKEICTTFMTRIKFHQNGNMFLFPDVEGTHTHEVENVVLLQPTWAL